METRCGTTQDGEMRAQDLQLDHLVSQEAAVIPQDYDIPPPPSRIFEAQQSASCGDADAALNNETTSPDICAPPNASACHPDETLALFDTKLAALSQKVCGLQNAYQDGLQGRRDLETALQEREDELKRALAVLEKERRVSEVLRARQEALEQKEAVLERTKRLGGDELMEQLHDVEERYGEMLRRNDALLEELARSKEASDANMSHASQKSEIESLRKQLQKAAVLVDELRAENAALAQKQALQASETQQSLSLSSRELCVSKNVEKSLQKRLNALHTKELQIAEQLAASQAGETKQKQLLERAEHRLAEEKTRSQRAIGALELRVKALETQKEELIQACEKMVRENAAQLLRVQEQNEWLLREAEARRGEQLRQSAENQKLQVLLQQSQTKVQALQTEVVFLRAQSVENEGGRPGAQLGVYATGWQGKQQEADAQKLREELGAAREQNALMGARMQHQAELIASLQQRMAQADKAKDFLDSARTQRLEQQNARLRQQLEEQGRPQYSKLRAK